MARIVETHRIPILTLMMYTSTKNGRVILHEFKEGDMIEELRYIENGEIKTITGRLSRINFMYRPVCRTYTSIMKLHSHFGEDIPVESIEIDASEQYHSNVVTVTAKDIVEFLPDIEDAVRVWFELKYAVKMIVELSDNTQNEFVVHEGDIFNSVTHVEKCEDVTEAMEVRVMEYDSELTPIRFIGLVNGRIKSINPLNIKNMEGVSPTVSTAEALNDALANTETGIVSFASGIIDAPVNFTKDVVLRGSHADAPMNHESVAAVADISTLAGKLTFAPGIKVVLNGVCLSKEALLHIDGLKEVEIKNCVIRGLYPDQPKTYAIKTEGETPIKLSVHHCFFGENNDHKNVPELGGMNVYNFFELNQKLADGSSISNNFFEYKSETHNTINIYDVDMDSNIYIRGNYWEYSGNAIRIGTKGDAHCNIFIEDNEYKKTDSENPDYAGLLLVQPYGMVTTDMSHVTISLKNNRHPDELQLYYLYAGGGDMQFTEENKPKIIEG